MSEKHVQEPNITYAIQQMRTAIKKIPFPKVIEALSGRRVIPFDHQNPADKKLLDDLCAAAGSACAAINKNGIRRKRANEVGNDIERFVSAALKEQGYDAGSPSTAAGRIQAVGYPDLCFKDGEGRVNYVECKTYNLESISTTMRSFYLSPSENFKITADAHHFGLSFEIEAGPESVGERVYRCAGWKVLTLDKLEVDVKYEFNSDNKRLYKEELVLAQGKI